MRIHSDLFRLKETFIIPTVMFGTRRDLLTEYKIGYIRYVSFIWLSWELRLFTVKTKAIRAESAYKSYFKDIERQNGEPLVE